MTSEELRRKKAATKAILFDKDGTLLDFDATWTPAYEEAARLASRGVTTDAERFLELTGLDLATRRSEAGSLLAAGNSEEIAEAWIAGGADFGLADLTTELDRIFVSKMHDAAPLPGIREAVDALLARGFRLGVASSDSEAAIRAFLEGTNLAPKFDFVTGYDTGHGPKPEPGMVHGFADAISVPTSGIAVIGDNTHDIEMAHAAGAGLTIGVLTGTSARQELSPHADVVLESAADLIAFFP
ncbi:HAD family hydrolase [Roseibium album]|uniref:HAD family hydrolase n=1 Tax=Roseibium album TaxID=311410 RepID=UPI0024930AA3|nr:HAD family hydrolase [Roseibium album]